MTYYLKWFLLLCYMVKLFEHYSWYINSIIKRKTKIKQERSTIITQHKAIDKINRNCSINTVKFALHKHVTHFVEEGFHKTLICHFSGVYFVIVLHTYVDRKVIFIFKVRLVIKKTYNTKINKILFQVYI